MISAHGMRRACRRIGVTVLLNTDNSAWWGDYVPYDPGLAERLRELLDHRSGFEQKKMFGGIGWMLNGNMCVGVYKDWLITRVGESAAPALFREMHVKPMDITGKPMKGWAMVAPEGVAQDAALKRHVEAAVTFVTTLPKK
jgi:hypothetical protein